MSLHFTKMEGAGNDYVYVDGTREHIPAEEKPELVRKLSDRHFGIGGDGVIFINPGRKADFEMEMYNADGSRGEMCGNGIRCVGKYVFDRGMVTDREFTVESFGQVHSLSIMELDENRKAAVLRVNMGKPILKAELIPVKADTEEVVDAPIAVDGEMGYRMTCVSMGNPHAVVFVDDVDHFDVAGIGPMFEHHERFPKRTNTEFVQVVDRSHVKMRVWERGTGETLACGTGCCASAVACILNGRTEDTVEIQVLGGRITIAWDRASGEIFMTGPAREVFTGEYDD